jgi:hypothetical protein
LGVLAPESRKKENKGNFFVLKIFLMRGETSWD